MNEIMTISGVECYEQNGNAYLKLETVARGLGFTTVAASGNEVVRWNTVHKYLSDLGVATSCNGSDYRSMCPDFIPENIFYRLAMKAKNEAAEHFQAKVADEIIPSIRKHGAYMTPETIEAVSLHPDIMIQLCVLTMRRGFVPASHLWFSDFSKKKTPPMRLISRKGRPDWRPIRPRRMVVLLRVVYPRAVEKASLKHRKSRLAVSFLRCWSSVSDILSEDVVVRGLCIRPPVLVTPTKCKSCYDLGDIYKCNAVLKNHMPVL